MPRSIRITSLPSRYEPLIQTFGDKAKTTFIAADEDLAVIKRLLARAESAGQGKILFISAPSGSGKSTLVQSAEIFLPDEVAKVVRLAPPHELPIDKIPSALSQLSVESKKFTIVNFDGREAPSFNEPEYKNFLGQLNGILRTRRDLVVLWPVTDYNFAERIVDLLSGIGGQSAFGNEKVHRLNGLRPSQFKIVMEKILNIANWTLEDAAISSTEVDAILTKTTTIGQFLDQVQDLIAQRFDVEKVGIRYQLRSCAAVDSY
jgi:energy-coupling factor transporter ATP-binding protein EcfA2